MTENPYEPPATPPESQRPGRATWVTLLLSVLAVPAAGIAGGTTCAAASTFALPAIGILALVLGLAGGFAAAGGILILAHRFTGIEKRPNYANAFIGLAIASPIAVLATVFCFIWLFLPATPNPTDHFNEALKLSACGGLAFLFLSLGGWIGMRTGRPPPQRVDTKA